MPISPTLMNKIFVVTQQIQMDFPAQYEVLSETPLFLNDTERKIIPADFEKYLDSIQNQVKAFERASINRLSQLGQGLLI